MAPKSSRPNQSSLPDASDLNPNTKPPLPPTITFGRETSSGRYISYSRDGLDNELGNSDYTVHIPPSPDNQMNDAESTASERMKEQFVSNSIFTGGSNVLPRAHPMNRVTEAQMSRPKVVGDDIVPCECDYKICRDCFLDAVKSEEAICPGCKDPYKSADVLKEKAAAALAAMNNAIARPPLPLLQSGSGMSRTDSGMSRTASGMSRMERRLSLMKSTKSSLTRSQTGDFDQNRWLYETRGTYGYGNVIWPKEGGPGSEKDGDEGVEPVELMSKPWKPLTRKLNIQAAVLSPYRFLLSLSHLNLLLLSLPFSSNSWVL